MKYYTIKRTTPCRAYYLATLFAKKEDAENEIETWKKEDEQRGIKAKYKIYVQIV